MSYTVWISCGALVGLALSMGSCVLTKTHHLSVIGCILLGALVGGTIKLLKNKFGK